MDRQLRDLLDAAVGEPPHRVSVEAVRRRVIRRRVTEFVAGGAAVAVIAAAILVGIGALGRGPGPAVASRVVPTVYVCNDAGTITPITIATNTAGKPISVGRNPPGFDPGWIYIAITPDGKTAYVANTAAGTVIPIATATNTAGKPIKVGEGSFPVDAISCLAITP